MWGKADGRACGEGEKLLQAGEGAEGTEESTPPHQPCLGQKTGFYALRPLGRGRGSKWGAESQGFLLPLPSLLWRGTGVPLGP